MTHHNTWAKRLAVLAAAGAISLTGITTAQALEGPPSNPHVIDAKQAVTLTIHKHVGDDVNANASYTSGDNTVEVTPNGKEITNADAVKALGDGLDGVEFTAQALCYDGEEIDLGVPAQWKLIKDDPSELDLTDAAKVKAKIAEKDSKYSLCGTALKGTTASGGVVNIGNVKQRLYLVKETGLPTKKNVKDATPDFIVTLPLANSDTDKNTKPWLYDVHVYPKNKLGTQPTKTADVKGVGVIPSIGDRVTYTLTGHVPGLTSSQKYYDSVTFVDKLPDGLTFVPAATEPGATSPKKPSTVTVTREGKPLTEGKHYTLDTTSNKTITVTFLKTKEIAAATSSSAAVKGVDVTGGDALVVTIKDLKLDPDQAGDTIINSFDFTVNNNTYKPDGPAPTQLNYGHFDLFKYKTVGEGGAAKKVGLEGAQFELCKKADGKNECASTGSEKLKDDPETDDNESAQAVTFKSNAYGNVYGRVFIGEGTDVADTQGDFCLVEVVAPGGYKRDATPQCFTLSSVTRNKDGKIVESSESVPADARIVANTDTAPQNKAFGSTEANTLALLNEEEDGFFKLGLPKTGAAGFMILTLGGAAAALIGIGTVLVARRRREED